MENATGIFVLRELTNDNVHIDHLHAYQVEVTERSLQLQGQHILFQRHKIQREVCDVHIPDDTGFFEYRVAYKSPSGDPENGELMFHVSVPLQALYLLCKREKVSAHLDGIHSVGHAKKALKRRSWKGIKFSSSKINIGSSD